MGGHPRRYFWGQLPQWNGSHLESTDSRQCVGERPLPRGANCCQPAEASSRGRAASVRFIFSLSAFPLYEPIAPLLSVPPPVGVNFLTQTLAFSPANGPNTSKAPGRRESGKESIGQPIPWRLWPSWGMGAGLREGQSLVTKSGCVAFKLRLNGALHGRESLCHFCGAFATLFLSYSILMSQFVPTTKQSMPSLLHFITGCICSFLSVRAGTKEFATFPGPALLLPL